MWYDSFECHDMCYFVSFRGAIWREALLIERGIRVECSESCEEWMHVQKLVSLRGAFRKDWGNGCTESVADAGGRDCSGPN